MNPNRGLQARAGALLRGARAWINSVPVSTCIYPFYLGGEPGHGWVQKSNAMSPGRHGVIFLVDYIWKETIL